MKSMSLILQTGLGNKICDRHHFSSNNLTLYMKRHQIQAYADDVVLLAYAGRELGKSTNQTHRKCREE